MGFIVEKVGPYASLLVFGASILVLLAAALQREYSKLEAQRLQKRSDELIALQQEALNFQTGGDAIPAIRITPKFDQPTPEVELALDNLSLKYPIPDVLTIINDMTAVMPLSEILETVPPDQQQAKIDESYGKAYSVPPKTLPAKGVVAIGSIPVNLADNHLAFTATMMGRGERRWTQRVSFRLVDGEWLRASQVYDEFKNVKYDTTDERYPRDDDGNPVW